MKLTPRDEAALNGVHPDLVTVIRASAERTVLKWFVNEGLRTPARQHALHLLLVGSETFAFHGEFRNAVVSAQNANRPARNKAKCGVEA